MDLDEKERKENLDIMKDPNKWVCWPILPMKKVVRKSELQDSGFMLATGEPIVYLKNMYDLKGGTVKDIMKNTPSKTYESFDAILDGGWVVD